MDWIKNKLINNSEVARRLGLSPSLFHRKLNEQQGKRFSTVELAKLNEIREELQGWKSIDELPECREALTLIRIKGSTVPDICLFAGGVFYHNGMPSNKYIEKYLKIN